MNVAVPPTHDIFSVMTVPPEAVTEREAEAVAAAGWRVRTHAVPLTGERDRNFRLDADDGRQFVLKIANPAEDPAVTDFQIGALLHVERADPHFPVPRMIAARDGTYEQPMVRPDGRVLRARLLSWLPGIQLSRVPRTDVQRRACGASLARLGLALRDFRHPAAHQPLIWDLQHALRLRELLDVLDHSPARMAVAATLDAFEAEVAPLLPSLRRQVLYDDMNGGNTLVDETDHDRVVGIIDFGDLVETALAIDVAVGACSQLAGNVPAVAAVVPFVAGFQAVRPLQAVEVGLLPLLIASRLSISLLLRAWHRRMQPANPHYRDLTPADYEWTLGRIAEVRTSATASALRRASGLA